MALSLNIEMLRSTSLLSFSLITLICGTMTRRCLTFDDLAVDTHDFVDRKCLCAWHKNAHKDEQTSNAYACCVRMFFVYLL